MKRKSLLLLFVCLTLLAHAVKVNVKNAVDFVNPLVGSDSNPELSTGNTYPAIAMPWAWFPLEQVITPFCLSSSVMANILLKAPLGLKEPAIC